MLAESILGVALRAVPIALSSVQESIMFVTPKDGGSCLLSSGLGASGLRPPAFGLRTRRQLPPSSGISDRCAILRMGRMQWAARPFCGP
jgi:hypothetical protein